jgi:hypothetical protein
MESDPFRHEKCALRPPIGGLKAQVPVESAAI